MKNNHTDITIVLDRSGSMADVAGDTIGGFNRFLDDQQKAPGTAALTLHQFDDVFDTVLDGCEVKSAKPLTNATFVPRGSTALLDAIGRAITRTGARLDKTPEHERAAKIVFVIITDGHENASREFTRFRVLEMIKHQREKYAWEFVFLGANHDAIAAAAAVGIGPANAMTYAHNAVGTSGAFASVAKNLTHYRCAAKVDMSFEADDRAVQSSAGAETP